MKKSQRTTQTQRNFLRRKSVRAGLRKRDWATARKRYEQDSVPCPVGYGSWNEFTTKTSPRQ